MNNLGIFTEALRRLSSRVRKLEVSARFPWTAFSTGWIPAGETWIYASSSSFTISGDLTGKYQVGDKLKLTQTSDKYFVIIAISYSDPNTTVTVEAGTSYTVANAAIANPYFSRLPEPLGWPEWFSFSGSFYSGVTVGDGTWDIAKFRFDGPFIDLRLGFSLGSTSAVTGTIAIDIPVDHYEESGSILIGTVSLGNYGVLLYKASLVSGSIAGTAIIWTGKVSGSSAPDYVYLGALNSAIPFTWGVQDFIRVNAKYRWR